MNVIKNRFGNAEEDDWDDEFEWIEFWCEEAQRLQDAGDHAGYVALCQDRLKRDPTDLHGVEALADAYLESNEPEKALQLVQASYRRDPDHPFAERVILDVLVAQGRSIEDYPWLRPPGVIHLDAKLLNELARKLKPKRKPVNLFDLWFELECRGYPLFSEDALVEALAKDERFAITDHEIKAQSGVSLVRREKR